MKIFQNIVLRLIVVTLTTNSRKTLKCTKSNFRAKFLDMILSVKIRKLLSKDMSDNCVFELPFAKYFNQIHSPKVK